MDAFKSYADDINVEKQKNLKTFQKYNLTIADKKLEYQYFKLLVLAKIMSQPFFMTEKLIEQKNPLEMYKRSIHENTNFQQFDEWINNDVRRELYNSDN